MAPHTGALPGALTAGGDVRSLPGREGPGRGGAGSASPGTGTVHGPPGDRNTCLGTVASGSQKPGATSAGDRVPQRRAPTEGEGQGRCELWACVRLRAPGESDWQGPGERRLVSPPQRALSARAEPPKHPGLLPALRWMENSEGRRALLREPALQDDWVPGGTGHRESLRQEHPQETLSALGWGCGWVGAELLAVGVQKVSGVSALLSLRPG